MTAHTHTLPHVHLEMPPLTPREIGVRPLNLAVVGEPINKLQARMMTRLLERNLKNGGVNRSAPEPETLVLFPAAQPLEEEEGGLFELPSPIRKSVNAVSLVTLPRIAPNTDLISLNWTMLCKKAAQYGLLAIGDSNRDAPERVYVFSMEGSHTAVEFAGRNEDEVYAELVERLTALAGAQKASNWQVDYSMPQRLWESARVPQEIIDAGRRLRALGLLPDIHLEDYGSSRRAKEIRLFLEVSGLTVGNMSAWDENLGVMHITGSGFDKGNLVREQIVAIKGVNETRDGTIVWAPEGARRVKPSVESFDQAIAFYASALWQRGDLRDGGLRELQSKLRDPHLLDAVNAQAPFFRSIIHLHVWPQKILDEKRVRFINVDPQLCVHHSSCGTMPLALYSVEALLRGLHEMPNDEQVLLVGLPNHGLLAASKFRLGEMIDQLDPRARRVQFAGVPQV
ncbi:MAG: hypothetical protein HY327_04605 [Chloroflexi bacterium]|nr:hypothetical protein [Chloroflexota bacterium]